FLGLVVTATHTIGVYLLGLFMLTARASVMPERLFPWISVASGLVVLAVGASLAARRLEAASAGHHHHDHPHHHEHDHDHVHLTADGTPLGWRGLLALGVSGGLLPCPSALVVMLGAIALGRIAFGLLLIVAFSAGLATVLTAIGLALVYARGLFERLPLDGRLARFAPVASALVISAAGLAIGLGLNLLRTLRAGGTLHHHVHRHGGRPHVHPHLHGAHEVAPDGHHHLRAGRRPFLVGLVHGLAGSGALMLAVLATIPSPALALAYVVIFGAGSMGGMVAMITLFGVPLALAGGRFARAELGIRLGAALGSLAVVLRLAWQLGTGA